MERILHQLRLVVYPIIYKVLYIPGGAGFLNHQQYRLILGFPSKESTRVNMIKRHRPEIKSCFVCFACFRVQENPPKPKLFGMILLH